METPTININSTIEDLCRYRFGQHWEREHEILMDLIAHHGLTIIFDTSTGDVTFLPGTGHLMPIEEGWAKVIPPTSI